jgi:type I restriction enzyme S subunit
MVPEFDYPQAKAYLFFALQEPRFRERAIGFATGTTVLAMPKEAVEEYQVPLPPPPLLKAFGQVVAPILERVEQGEIQSGSLAKIRDTLLPRIMSGKLRIPDAEEVMA